MARLILVPACVFPKPSVRGGVHICFTSKPQPQPAGEQEAVGLGRGIRWAEGSC